MKHLLFACLTAATLCVTSPLIRAAERPKPLKVLLVIGGCCHDYKAQKDLLKAGLEARANVVVDQVYAEGDTTSPKLAIYGNPDYAKGYDLVIHDECAAAIIDPTVIAGVLKPHQDGIPAVNLHCAMHSYRFGSYQKPVPITAENGKWYEFIGLQSTGHGPQEPIKITFTEKENPITKGFTDWTTIKEELYNNVQLLPGCRPLARGQQTVKSKVKQDDGTEVEKETVAESVVVWTNTYREKTRVFSTSLGHNNGTVSDARYLDLVTRGLLWATNHLNDDGTPAPGYGPAEK